MAKPPYEHARDLLVAQGVADPSDFEIRAVVRLLRLEEASSAEPGKAPVRGVTGLLAVASWIQRNPVVVLIAVIFDIVLVVWAFMSLRPEQSGTPRRNVATRAAEAPNTAASPSEAYGPGGRALSITPEVVRRLGEPPPRSDGKTPDAVAAHVRAQSATATPEVFERCDDQYTVTAGGYELGCTFGSEDRSGWVIRYEGRFVLRQGSVVSYDTKKIP